MFYTIYKITNNVNGKYYIGKHQTKDLNDGYMGSGKFIKRAIEKYGVKNFTKEIIHVFDNEKDRNIIGNNVVATTIKNKVASPRRKCEFQIILGKGIEESESLYDEIKTDEPVRYNGKLITLDGSGAWKNFCVRDEKTQEVLLEKKLYKKEVS